MRPPAFLQNVLERDVHPVKVVTFKIDDKDVTAREDETILTVARQNGIFIPTFKLSVAFSVIPLLFFSNH